MGASGLLLPKEQVVWQQGQLQSLRQGCLSSSRPRDAAAAAVAVSKLPPFPVLPRLALNLTLALAHPARSPSPPASLVP